MTKKQDKTDALLDELLKECDDPKYIPGEHGLLQQMTKRMVERALEAEVTMHLGYTRHAVEGRGSGNSRNGKSKKTIQSTAGQFEIEVPRDRDGSFEPRLVKKRQRRLEGKLPCQGDSSKVPLLNSEWVLSPLDFCHRPYDERPDFRCCTRLDTALVRV